MSVCLFILFLLLRVVVHSFFLSRFISFRSLCSLWLYTLFYTHFISYYSIIRIDVSRLKPSVVHTQLKWNDYSIFGWLVSFFFVLCLCCCCCCFFFSIFDRVSYSLSFCCYRGVVHIVAVGAINVLVVAFLLFMCVIQFKSTPAGIMEYLVLLGVFRTNIYT